MLQPIVSVTTQAPDKFKRSNLRAIVSDGAAFSLMVGLGETYIPAFVLALGLGVVAAGLVATVPLLVGSILQLATPHLLARWGKYRGWVVLCVSGQGLSLLMMACLALRPQWSGWLVFPVAVVYWGCGLGAGPAWNAWVEHLVPRRLRASFFARRVRVSQLGNLIGLVCGGLMLKWGVSIDHLREAFAAIFTVAGVARFVSASLLARQTETDAMWQAPLSTLPGNRLVWSGSGTRLVIYLICVQVAVYVSGPYFTPYMLSKLHFSYLQYMLLLSTAFAGKIVALPWFGAYAKRAGASRLLWLGGIGIIPVAGWWLFSRSFPYLIAVQFFSGVVWAGYELAMMLLFFESIPREQRVRVLTLYNFGNSAAMAGGALIGAMVFRWLGDGGNTYLTLFAISSLGRATTLVLLPGAPQRVLEAAPFALRTLNMRSLANALDRSSLPVQSVAEKPRENTAA